MIESEKIASEVQAAINEKARQKDGSILQGAICGRLSSYSLRLEVEDVEGNHKTFCLIVAEEDA